MTHPFIVGQGPIFNHQSMTIPEHFIQLDKYVFVQGLDDVSSWWFLTRFQFCFSDKCTFPNAVLIFRALSDYQLYSLYNQLQACHSARQTRNTLCIPSPCRPHTSTKVYPFPTLVNKINKYYLGLPSFPSGHDHNFYFCPHWPMQLLGLFYQVVSTLVKNVSLSLLFHDTWSFGNFCDETFAEDVLTKAVKINKIY